MHADLCPEKRGERWADSNPGSGGNQHLKGPLGGSRVSLIPTPLNLKGFFYTFVFEQLNDILRNPSYQKEFSLFSSTV